MKILLVFIWLNLNLAYSHETGWVSWSHYRSGNVNICEILMAHKTLEECVNHIKKRCLRYKSKSKVKVKNDNCKDERPYGLHMSRDKFYNYRCLPPGVDPRYQQRNDQSCTFSKQ